jgi:hypothetical protein
MLRRHADQEPIAPMLAPHVGRIRIADGSDAWTPAAVAERSRADRLGAVCPLLRSDRLKAPAGPSRP